MLAAGMNAFVRQLVRQLLTEDREQVRDGLSRNRHFEVFEDAQGRTAHRIFRRLRVLARDIRAAAPAPLEVSRIAARAGGRREVTRPVRLRVPLPGGVRTAFLSEDELELLSEAADVGERLAG